MAGGKSAGRGGDPALMALAQNHAGLDWPTGPWMKTWVVEFLASGKVQIMEALELGAYWSLIMVSWREGPLEDNAIRLAKLARVSPEEFEEVWPEVSLCFRLLPDYGWVCPRVEVERAAMIARSVAARSASGRRWEIEMARRAEICSSESGGNAKTDETVCKSVSVSVSGTATNTPAVPAGLSGEISDGGTGAKTWQPRHPQTAALGKAHGDAIAFFKPDAKVTTDSVTSLRAYDALLVTDAREPARAFALLNWLFGAPGTPITYRPSESFDWRPNIMSGTSLRKAWDKLDFQMGGDHERAADPTRRRR